MKSLRGKWGCYLFSFHGPTALRSSGRSSLTSVGEVVSESVSGFCCYSHADANANARHKDSSRVNERGTELLSTTLAMDHTTKKDGEAWQAASLFSTREASGLLQGAYCHGLLPKLVCYDP